MKWILLSLCLLGHFSCKTLGTARDRDAALASDASERDPTCTAVEGNDASALNGKDIFNLTGRCVFGKGAHTIKIRILSETFQKVLDDGCAGQDTGYGHILAFEFDGKVLPNVGIKVRGNTSKCNPKRQFKFAFGESDLFSKFQGTIEEKKFPENKGRTLFGLESLSLRASANDPTMLREKISSETFSAAAGIATTSARGGLVYRVGFSKLFVSFNRSAQEGPEGHFTHLLNGYYYDYKGFYSLAENIDKVFLRTRFQAADEKLGDFHLYGADLGLARFDRATYDPKGWSLAYFKGEKVKTAEQKKAAEAFLLSAFDVLQDSSSDAQLAASFDIESVVNYVASAILSGHWDSVLANANNDYLFYDPTRKVFQLMAWDLDNSLGANNELYKKLMSPDIFAPGKENPAKLFTVLFAPKRTGFRKLLAKRLEDLLGGFYDEARFESYMDKQEAFIRRSAESWEEADASHFKDIKNFAKAKRSSVRSQLP